MIRAIIFDCFGVLTSEGWLPFKKKYFGDKPEQLQQATDLSQQLNSGLIEPDVFIAQIAELAGVSKSEALRALEHNVPNEELFTYIETNLKPQYKLGILSNAGGNRLHQLFTEEQLQLFDNAALSYETGNVKPEKAAYEQIADDLGVTPEECIFIDDQERHCIGARETGMHAIVFIDVDQCQQAITKIVSGNTKN